jgi:hypothetical protein
LVDALAVGSESSLGCLGGLLAVFEALFDAVLLVERKSRLDLVHHTLILLHDLQSLVDVGLQLLARVQNVIRHKSHV